MLIRITKSRFVIVLSGFVFDMGCILNLDILILRTPVKLVMQFKGPPGLAGLGGLGSGEARTRIYSRPWVSG
ncbi:MAG: hypothetical protein M1608_13080 [Candidatus Omnitrophica bacterium]|nr:hypothetical protein [Candidatus Omnitrophota bacterium]